MVRSDRRKSVVAFRRDDEGEIVSAKVFGLVQTYDEKPRRRLWELMKRMRRRPRLITAFWQQAELSF